MFSDIPTRCGYNPYVAELCMVSVGVYNVIILVLKLSWCNISHDMVELALSQKMLNIQRQEQYFQLIPHDVWLGKKTFTLSLCDMFPFDSLCILNEWLSFGVLSAGLLQRITIVSASNSSKFYVAFQFASSWWISGIVLSLCAYNILWHIGEQWTVYWFLTEWVCLCLWILNEPSGAWTTSCFFSFFYYSDSLRAQSL